jgi:ubiquinone/menaquinone biosynthesis C-methylase UbiE
VSDSRASDSAFLPAAGRGLTSLYDPVVALTMRERTFRSRLVAQVADGQPSAVLEIGCGTGSLTVRLAQALPAAAIVGLDPDPDVLERARAKDSRKRGQQGSGQIARLQGSATGQIHWPQGKATGQIEWLHGTATELPLGDRSCERVVASLVLHHLTTAEKRVALTEAHRVLRPGGRLHVADWGAPQDVLMGGAFLALRTLDGFERTRAHARGELPALIEQAGFCAVARRDRLRTCWGSLELLSAERPSD